LGDLRDLLRGKLVWQAEASTSNSGF